jgi:hypothetical protein
VLSEAEMTDEDVQVDTSTPPVRQVASSPVATGDRWRAAVCEL